MTLLAILLLLIYFGALSFILIGIGRGKFHYLLTYLITFLPIYIVFLSFIYSHTESVILVRIIQYSKEVVLLYSFIACTLSHKQNLIFRRWELSSLDKLFLVFCGLSFTYLIIPLGEASYLNKATYFKNILLLCLAYFFGRQISFSWPKWNRIFGIVFVVTTLAFLVVISERLIGRHFHSMVGYSDYNSAINGIDPAGNYGLIWTFEAQAGQPRYGAFFSNPLEFSASMLICFSLTIIYLLSMKYNTNRFKYSVLLLFSFVCVLFAYSRATMVAFFGVLLFMAFLLRYYKIILLAGSTAILLGLYVLFLAPDETRYFVSDTIMFQNSSSITHVIEWLEGVESMAQNPMGIGLAMSGNSGGVEDELRVSGENQFLIYGVQLGVFGMLIYVFMITLGIIHCWKAFRRSNSRQEQVIPFIGACVKFGLLLPLLTANAESYLYVSLVSWWFVGTGETLFQKYKLKGIGVEKNISIHARLQANNLI